MGGSKGYVLDASAILALLQAEPGEEAIAAAIAGGGSVICAVNYSEVVARLIFRGAPEKTAADVVDSLGLKVVPFDKSLAALAAFMQAHTSSAGLSLGDRACLALSRQTGFPALTTDKAWAGLKFQPKIHLIR